jgi:hypothetical protein
LLHGAFALTLESLLVVVVVVAMVVHRYDRHVFS